MPNNDGDLFIIYFFFFIIISPSRAIMIIVIISALFNINNSNDAQLHHVRTKSSALSRVAVTARISTRFSFFLFVFFSLRRETIRENIQIKTVFVQRISRDDINLSLLLFTFLYCNITRSVGNLLIYRNKIRPCDGSLCK